MISKRVHLIRGWPAALWSDPLGLRCLERERTDDVDICAWKNFWLNLFNLVGLEETGAVVLRLRRIGVADTVGNMEPCVMAMEACCGAHRLGRLLGASGDTIRLMPPEYVRICEG